MRPLRPHSRIASWKAVGRLFCILKATSINQIQTSLVEINNNTYCQNIIG